MTETTVTKEPESINSGQEECDSKPFIMRRVIRSTAYEVAVHFSKTSKETLTDKILRLIRNEARQ